MSEVPFPVTFDIKGKKEFGVLVGLFEANTPKQKYCVVSRISKSGVESEPMIVPLSKMITQERVYFNMGGAGPYLLPKGCEVALGDNLLVTRAIVNRKSMATVEASSVIKGVVDKIRHTTDLQDYIDGSDHRLMSIVLKLEVSRFHTIYEASK